MVPAGTQEISLFTLQQPARLPGLDTLRALAITLVFIFHLQFYLPSAFQFIDGIGWMGVDLFFVLSGYLIGRQLLKPYLRKQRPGLAVSMRAARIAFCPPTWWYSSSTAPCHRGVSGRDSRRPSSF